MTKSQRIIFVFATVLVSLLAVLAATVFLGFGEDSHAATEIDVCPTCTFKTIQAAVEAASDGDTIRVVTGSYSGIMSHSDISATVVLSKDLTLLGGYSPDFSQRDPKTYVTTIDTEDNLWGGVCICDSQSTVDGFHIVNAFGGGVAVIKESAVGTVTNNTIAFNRIVTGTEMNAGGAGIRVSEEAEAVITHNIVVSNTIERPNSWGGGIETNRAVVEIASNTFAYNLTYSDTVGGGLDIYHSNVIITNNNVHHNANVGIGIYRSQAEVISNTVDGNTTIYGGGGIDINSESTYTVTGNTISNNLAKRHGGGGIHVTGKSIGTIEQNLIIDNHGVGDGGGIATWNISQIVIRQNEIKQNTALYGGGGIRISGDNDGDLELLTIEQNMIHANTSEFGAGVHVSGIDGPAFISQNDVRHNRITGEDYQPGGIYVSDTGGVATVVNNIVADNDNRGVKGVNYLEIELINNTIVGNGSTAVEMHAWPVSASVPLTATVVNNVIADHLDCAFSGFYNAVFAMHNNDVVGHDLDDCGAEIISQSDNINADPLFVDEIGGDYHLAPRSPAIDTGQTGVGIPDVDIEGNGRPQGIRTDMGAYEATRYLVLLPITLK